MTDQPERPDPGAQTATLSHLLEALRSARTTCDARLPHAEGDLAHLIRKFREEHHQHAERVAAILFALGRDAGAEADVRDRLRVTLGRVFAGAGDAESLARSGEALIESFDRAIAVTPGNAHRRQLEEMRAETAKLVLEAREPGPASSS